MDMNPYESPRVATENGEQEEADDMPWAFALFFYMLAGLMGLTVLAALN